MNLGDRLQFAFMTMRAGVGSGHGEDLIDTLGLFALPRRMTFWSAPLLRLCRWARGLGSDGRTATFELAAVQGVELGLELLVVPLQLLVGFVGLLKMLVEFFQLMFIVAFQPGGLLITRPDPLRGQAFQIRTAVAVRATEVIGQVSKEFACSRCQCRRICFSFQIIGARANRA